MNAGKSPEEQVLIVIKALEGKKLSKESPIFKKVLEWVNFFPPGIDQALKRRLVEACCEAFELTGAELFSELSGVTAEKRQVAAKVPVSREKSFEALLPKGGWFESYNEYTRYNEAPLTYHTISGLAVLASCLGRRCYLDMGHFKIYPSFPALLIGPPGRVKKTTATDIAKALVEECTICPVMADKLTPESLQTALARDGGHQFLILGELAAFLGKQRYNEGLVALLLRLLDCPSSYKVETQTRGEEIIERPTVTMLGASTMTLLANSTPDEVMSSGFLSRFLVVIEDDTERCFPRPWIGDGHQQIKQAIRRMKLVEGRVSQAPDTMTWYDNWYISRKRLRHENHLMAELVDRLTVHMLRLSMIIHLVECNSLSICVGCTKTAVDIMEHLEKGLPRLIISMDRTAIAQDVDYVLQGLVKLGGACDHTSLLRRVINRMSATQFKGHVATLAESGKLKITKKGAATYYTLSEE